MGVHPKSSECPVKSCSLTRLPVFLSQKRVTASVKSFDLNASRHFSHFCVIYLLHMRCVTVFNVSQFVKHGSVAFVKPEEFVGLLLNTPFQQVNIFQLHLQQGPIYSVITFNRIAVFLYEEVYV